MALTLAIDQGTHSTRAVVFDVRGRQLAMQRAPVTLQVHSHTEIEQSADEIIQSMRMVIAGVLAHPAVDPTDIRQVGLATQRSSVLAWERQSGKALSPVLSWQDTRTRSDLRQYEAQLDNIRARTGLRLSAHYGAGKLQWLLRNSSAVRDAASSNELVTGPLASYLLHHLCDGSINRVDHANASRTLLWNLEQRDWDPWLCGLFGIPAALLPECRPICSNYGTSIINSAPVMAVNGDQTAALYAHGQPGTDTILVNIGTGAFVLLPTGNTPRFQPDLLTGISRSNANAGDYYIEGTVNGAGAAVQWAEEHFELPDWQNHLPGWLAEIEAPPLFLNTVGGLGAPWWRPGPAPGFIDIDDPAAIDPAAALVAVIESIAFMVATNIRHLHGLQADIRQIRISGGLSQLDGLCQRIANLAGLTVERPPQLEATTRGIAWLAAGRPDDWEATGKPTPFEPQNGPALEARYRRFSDTIHHT
ncbi:MAG: FGGY family carbohydrate kinase [Pseudomonadota bacterium]